MEDLKTIETVDTSPFKRLCMTIGELPASFVDSMTYYECLAWLVNYLQNTVIPAVNNNAEATEELQTAFVTLKNYVDHYFDNLDVQEEINNKIDEMVQSGYFDQIFAEYVTPQLTALDNKINTTSSTLNAKIDNTSEVLNERIDDIAEKGITPLVAADVSGMTNQGRIYVNSTDGHWYYYANNQWNDGGLYQSDGISPSDPEIDGRNVKMNKMPSYFNVNEMVNNITLVEGNISYNNTTKVLTYQAMSPGWPRVRTEENAEITFSGKTVLVNLNPNLMYWVWGIDPDTGLGEYSSNWISAEKFILDGNPDYYYAFLFKTTNGTSAVPMSVDDCKLAFKVGSGVYSELPLIIPSRITPINIDTTAKTVFFPQDLLFIFGNKTHRFNTVGGQTLSYNTGSSAVKIYYNTKTDTFSAYTWSVTPTDELLIATLRTSTDDANLVSFEINCPFTINGNYFFNYQVDEIKRIAGSSNMTNVNMRSVAHQGYSTTAQPLGNCRLSSYIGAKIHGFDYGECDVKWSSDNVPVCCHDATFYDATSGTTITINEHTWAELQTYDYYGETIASLEQVIAKCKELGLGLYVDHLQTWDSTKWSILFGLVKKYQMQDNIYWLQGVNRGVTTGILNFYKKSKICLVAGDSTQFNASIAEANAIKTDDNTVSIDFNYEAVSTSDLISAKANANDDIQFEVWIIDNATTYKNYLPYVNGITSNDYCYNDVYNDLLS